MNIEDYVATSLQQIIAGITRAQTETSATGARINPQMDGQGAGFLDWESGTRIQSVEFDIGVTVSESDKSGAGLKVGMAWIGGGIDAGSDRQHSAANRLKFSVPVVFPKHSYQNRDESDPAK